ncbi:MAG: helix-turn-helix transcriptional regulator [Candidatus Pacebacteria bacterium]|nr:helix-turn-helix transcriptional regulator [Candidatus Paceibacterota bacterium]
MKERSKVSLLAQTLRELIKASGINQKDWAKILSVSPAAISQWLNDKTLPRPMHIWTMVSIVSGRKDTTSAIEHFYEMVEVPAKQVTPHYNKIKKSIGHYIAHYHFLWVHQEIRKIVSRKTFRENVRIRLKIADFLLDLSR